MSHIAPEIPALIAQCAMLLAASCLICAAAVVALMPPANRRKAFRRGQGRMSVPELDRLIERGFR